MAARATRETPAQTVADVMHTRVVTIDPEATAEEAARLMTKHQVTGLPVVNERRRPIGVISATDLVRNEPLLEAVASQAVPKYYVEPQPERELFVDRMMHDEAGHVRVRELMTPVAFAVDRATPIAEAARIMLRRRIHRLLVTCGGALCGIVSALDLLRALTPPRR